jgi:hypothetical protein
MIGSWRAIDYWTGSDATVVANEGIQTVAARTFAIKENTLLLPRCERIREGWGGDR